MKKSVVILCVCIVSVLLATGLASAGADGPTRVVSNITTDDVNRAAMAIKFTQAAMENNGAQGVLFFNVYGVHLVNKAVPSPVYATGQSIHQMLEEFMAAGGSVLACPMCMKNVGGMSQADLLAGVHAKKGAGLAAVTTPDTLVLSY